MPEAESLAEPRWCVGGEGGGDVKDSSGLSIFHFTACLCVRVFHFDI